MAPTPGYTLDRDSRGLTNRERGVLAGLVEGRRPTQIAEVLGVSKQRVDQLLKALSKKQVIEHRNGSLLITVRETRYDERPRRRSRAVRDRQPEGRPEASWPR